MERRIFLKKGLFALAFTSMGATSLFSTNRSGILSMAQAQDALTALPIPPLLENMDNSGKEARFAVNVQKGTMNFIPGRPTSTLGYNGNFLGPTIRVKDGQRFRIDVNNRLNQTTTLHWHGLHVPAKWDGGPRQPIEAGKTWTPDFVVRQEAATLWYHPHAMGTTGEQVYQGLAGMFIIDDDFSDQLDIPKDYGINDIPLIIQDRRFFSSGQFAYVQNMHDVMNGVIGNQLLVNGAFQPTKEVPNTLVRFRLLNGSNSSIYNISFKDQRKFHVIASDGGFLERPAAMTSIVLSAGERAEVLVDFSNESQNTDINLRVSQMRGFSFDALNIVVKNTGQKTKELPQRLRPLDRIFEANAVRTRQFIMETGMMGRRLSINGKKMNLNRIDETVKRGAVEIWEISNRSGMMMRMPHSMHLHDVQFQIFSRNGRVPPAHERGRKDTVLIMPGETVRILIRFNNYTGIYMYHCHLLEHEDDGMMGQFEVID